MIFHNGSNDDYDFIVKTEELKDNLLGLEKILKNTQPFQFQQENKLQELIKTESKLQKPYNTN